MPKLSRSGKAAVIFFPGSNCDQETCAFLNPFYQNVDVIWHRDRFEAKSYDLVVLPGGFSYGDYVRAGVCAARSPAMADVIHFAKNGGPTIGICNGFQILAESGLLPGVLIRSELGRFDCRYVSLKNTSASNLKWQVPEQVILPIANTFGRFYLPDDQDSRLWNEGHVVYTYESQESISGIAALTNREGNVLGMMPHPERAWAPHHAYQFGSRLLPNGSDL